MITNHYHVMGKASFLDSDFISCRYSAKIPNGVAKERPKQLNLKGIMAKAENSFLQERAKR
jgi:hypothetical protein